VCLEFPFTEVGDPFSDDVNKGWLLEPLSREDRGAEHARVRPAADR
jgi:hypothetical protein